MDIATRRLPTATDSVAADRRRPRSSSPCCAAPSSRSGSPHRVPPPFGPAANGSILLSSNGGNIYVRDSVTGASRLLIGDSGADGEAGASPDGTLVAFVRYSYGQRYLMAANIDGSHSVRWLPEAA